ncbi:MAG TPA: thioredoxin family protein [Gammaproteobacteria bacterium]|nr:thioredoxin family protein [Gammaproteobacteria bacterium]
MVEWIGAMMLLLVALFAAFQMVIVLKARKMVGQPVPDVEAGSAMAGLHEGRTLLYFHAPGCTPCRRMSPVVEALAAQRGAVVSVDISQHPETARLFNIHATPTTIVVENGRIKQVLLGFQSAEKLKQLLG